MARPVGTTGCGYTLSPRAHDQRLKAGFARNKIFDDIIAANTPDLTDEKRKELMSIKMNIWNQLSTPMLFVANEIAELKTWIAIKQMRGEELSVREIQGYMKLLLEYVKEYNRANVASADKKIDVITKLDQLDGIKVVDVQMEEKENDVTTRGNDNTTSSSLFSS